MKLYLLFVAFSLLIEINPGQSPSAKSMLAPSDDRFERAIRNRSTAPNFVLVSITNENTGEKEEACILSPFLLGAIHMEMNLGYDAVGVRKATRLALNNRRREFTFKDKEALQNATPRYTRQILEEVRQYLLQFNNKQLLSGFGGGSGQLDSIYSEKEDYEQYVAYRDATAHVLWERGLLPGRGSIAGYLTVKR